MILVVKLEEHSLLSELVVALRLSNELNLQLVSIDLCVEVMGQRFINFVFSVADVKSLSAHEVSQLYIQFGDFCLGFQQFFITKLKFIFDFLQLCLDKRDVVRSWQELLVYCQVLCTLRLQSFDKVIYFTSHLVFDFDGFFKFKILICELLVHKSYLLTLNVILFLHDVVPCQLKGNFILQSLDFLPILLLLIMGFPDLGP